MAKLEHLSVIKVSGDDADEFYHRFQKQSIYQKLDWDNQSDE